MKYYPEYNWVVSPGMLIIPPMLYVIAAITTSRAWPSGKKLKVINWMRLYNVVQISLCLYMTIGLWPVVQFPNVFGINSTFTAQGEWFIFVHYLSKYLDWCDTLFIIVKDNTTKQLSLLHVYHHATIGVVWGILLYMNQGNGTARYGAFINSVTHVIMYSHYLWTSFGLKNPLRNLVTKWQIFQFYTCFAHAVLVITGVWIVEEQISYELGWMQFCYHITMIYLFTFKLRWVPKMPIFFFHRKSKEKSGDLFYLPQPPCASSGLTNFFSSYGTSNQMPSCMRERRI